MPSLAERAFDLSPQARGLRGRALVLIAVAGLGLVGALLAFAWAATNPIIEQIARIEGSRLPRLESIERTKYADLEASIALRNALLIKDRRLSDLEIGRYAELDRLASTTLDEFGRVTERADELALVSAALESRQSLIATRVRALKFEKQGGSEADTDDMTLQLQKSLESYLAILQRLYDYQGARVTALVDAMRVEAQRASWLLIAAGGTAAVTMLMLAASWRRETRRQVAERDQQISSLQRQRDALVREIHHRIKNHLQGLLGLFEGYRSAHDKATVEQSLATLHGHVLALVGIHGLQSRQLDETISLPKLAHQQVELIRAGFVGARLDISEQTSPEPLLLSADQAVPIALVITELIVNAIKHGAEGPISIAIGTGENGACVAVTNRIARPPGLQWGTQSGLGTGLGLVNTLIQGIGRLEQTTTLDQLTMALHLVTVSPAPPSSAECHAS